MPDYRPRLLERITAPATEPITLSEAKAYARIDHSDDDALITNAISVAREATERYLRRSLITQSWLLAYDDFPACETVLPYGPVQSISSVIMVARDSSTTIMSTDAYYLDAMKRSIIFETVPLSHRVEIRYVTGYGDTASDIPQPIKQAMLAYIALMMDNRALGTALPDGARMLMDNYREKRV